MSCIKYTGKVLNVGKSGDMLLYILEVALECQDSGIKKLAHVEVEVPKGEQLQLTEEMALRCWNEGQVINGDFSGEVMEEAPPEDEEFEEEQDAEEEEAPAEEGAEEEAPAEEEAIPEDTEADPE